MKTKTIKLTSPAGAVRSLTMPTPMARPVAVYARVSSEEQTKGNYPSCESQVEELVSVCQARGWEVRHIVKDEGFSAGSLKRPGLSQLRWMVENEEITAIVCTWYDRLTRSRDFYVLDKEFQQHGVQFVTLHDPTDTKTAAGRFMESMLVAAKTYEREQTGEKVRSKLRMRAEKGMWNGGPIPFGFLAVDKARTIAPDPDMLLILNEMFRVYTETQTDYKVRDWLQAHQVPTRSGEATWTVSSVCRILTNRRYIAQIEVNRENKGLEGLPESETYRLVPAPYEPMVPVALFELAQSIRAQKGRESLNRVGKPRSFSQTQCNRVFPLQGFMVCGHCGHAMTPWYIKHKAGQDKQGKKRRNDSFVYYYICALQRKGWKACDHKNCVLARKGEEWVLERIRTTMQHPVSVQAAVDHALQATLQDLAPLREIWEANQQALQLNQSQTDELVGAIASGRAQGPLWQMLNDKAAQLHLERERLMIEQRRLKEQLNPLNENFDAQELRNLMGGFAELARYAEPEELQRLLRLTVRRIEWKSDGNPKVQFYLLPKREKAKSTKTNCPPAQGAGGQWLYTDVCSDTPLHRGVEPQFGEPLVLEIDLLPDGHWLLDTARIRRISRAEALVEAALVDSRLRAKVDHLQEVVKEGI